MKGRYSRNERDFERHFYENDPFPVTGRCSSSDKNLLFKAD